MYFMPSQAPDGVHSFYYEVPGSMKWARYFLLLLSGCVDHESVFHSRVINADIIRKRGEAYSVYHSAAVIVAEEANESAV